MEELCFPLNVAKMSDAQEFESRLAAVVHRMCGTEAKLLTFSRLSGGASQETWLIEIQDGADTRQVVLRRSPFVVDRERASNAIGLDNEAVLIRAAYAAGVPSPQVLYVLGPDDDLGEGFFMSKVEGETIARRILRDEQFAAARHVLPKECGRALAKIHSIDGRSVPALQPSGTIDQLDHYEAVYRSTGVSRPIIEASLRWLRENVPAPMEPVVVHGDFRLGNIMVDENGLAAVLDWELAHVGDPREDVSWMCVNSWRFGQSENRLGGFGRVEDLLEAYAEAGGPVMTPRDIDWWEMLGSLKWGIMCMMMYETFRTGADSSVERAAIGRRVSETEIDLVNLLELSLNA